ncbi:histidinol-phosphate transaminase [Cerasicoccus arenae]|uniref:Histidinol-phosphate aminotransferase n=1 Tax=Cerasicoccus arenae TaxID=424488 RepID=A0A8J3GFD8_9BACT|nr:histidinol-phosphate transaminase [Cerasicoccus arenae]MBK1859400.1 histidinol-phosphate transaminase [Cerasicoccus arenae]GHC10774.1 histidinol-phosphate aminotransferase [Cerasicoccus arenae]
MKPDLSIESLALPHVAAMHAYVPGMQPMESGWVKLNTNENPFPPSPKVIEAIQRELANEARGLRLYPNPTSAPLRATIAAHHGLKVEQVLASNGCDDALNLLMRVFCSVDRPAGMTVPSYSLYTVLRSIQAAEMREVEFDRSFELPIDAIASSGANIFFLTSPNAPTGVSFAPERIAELLEKFSGILVVDETYAPFAEQNCVSLLADNPRLVIVRSFSKAYALAGMRTGYALANPEVISLLDRVRDSYNLDRLAQVAAKAALEDQAYYQGTIEATKVLRDKAAASYEERGWFVYPSAANFHFVEPRKGGGAGKAVAQDLFQCLLDNKILVRAFPNHALTQSFLRISVGSAEEMNRLGEILDAWQKK